MTDEIDTDWDSLEDAEDDEVTRVAASPLSVAPEAPEAVPPVTLSGAEPPPPNPFVLAPLTPETANPSRTLEPQAAGPELRTRLRSQTLIGMAPPARSANPSDPPSASATVDADVASLVGASAGLRAPSVQPGPAASRTLIGLLPPAPASSGSQPPQAESPSVSPLSASTAPSAFAPTVRASAPPPPSARPSSVPPPRARISSIPPPLPSAALAAPSPLPAPPSTPPAVDAGSNSPLKAVPVAAPIAADKEPNTGFGRWLAVLGIAVIFVALIGYRVLARDPSAPDPIRKAAAAGSIATPASPAPVAPDPSASTVDTGSASLAPATPAADLAGSAPAASAPTASAPTASSAEPETTDGQSHSVVLKSSPPKARFFHFGKEVGTAPFTLEFKPGERHSYEVGLPGYITRKVTVDGSKPEITVGLRKESR